MINKRTAQTCCGSSGETGCVKDSCWKQMWQSHEALSENDMEPMDTRTQSSSLWVVFLRLQRLLQSYYVMDFAQKHLLSWTAHVPSTSPFSSFQIHRCFSSESSRCEKNWNIQPINPGYSQSGRDSSLRGCRTSAKDILHQESEVEIHST